jgi:hypothetical protein
MFWIFSLLTNGYGAIALIAACSQVYGETQTFRLVSLCSPESPHLVPHSARQMIALQPLDLPCALHATFLAAIMHTAFDSLIFEWLSRKELFLKLPSIVHEVQPSLQAYQANLFPQVLNEAISDNWRPSVPFFITNFRSSCFQLHDTILLRFVYSYIDWIDLAQDRNRRRALVNTVMNLRVP